MVFPATPLPLGVELSLGGSWVNVTDEPVYRRGMVNINRGRSDEAGTVDRTQCRFELNNRSGDFSPRNPMSQYYGQLGRNTPCRVWVDGATTYLGLDGDPTSKITTPDAAALDIVGDIDIRVDLFLANWRESLGVNFIGKYEITSDQRSWAFGLATDGTLFFRWSTNGTLANTIEEFSTLPVRAPGSGRQAVRVTLDVNNGASGYDLNFYYGDTVDGPWTQLGTEIVGGATTSIFSSTAIVELGDVEDLTFNSVTGRIYEAKILSGIAGSEVANPDFTVQVAGDNSFADAAGRTWTVAGNAILSARRYRFHGEVASWPQRWDKTGTDFYVPIEAAGILRRIGTGSSVEGSVMYRALTRDTTDLVAYWPLEDETGSSQAGAALDTHGPLSISSGAPDFAAFSDFKCSNSIMRLNGSSFIGSVPAYTVGNFTQVRWLMNVPAAGAENGQTILLFYTTGSVRRWEVVYGTGGTLALIAYDADGTQLFTSGGVAFAVNGQLLRCSVELTQDGADIDWNILTLEPGASSGLTFSGTLTTDTVGKVGQIQLSPGGGIADISIGHLSVQNVVTSLFDLGAQLDAWRGETAGRRIERLCEEEGITFWGLGDLDASIKMGWQQSSDLLSILKECAETDDGMLFEPRDVFGLGYRTRESIYNQTARVALDYDSAELADSLDPTDDDQRTENDVTATKNQGSSARAFLSTGPLSILDPPNGVGRYDVSKPVNPEFDGQLLDHATWRLRLGTVDEARYPRITVDRSRSQIAGNAALDDSVLQADVGDRITIQDLPSQMPPEDVSQLVQGYSETMGNYEHEVTYNCSPESPYQVALYGDSAQDDRYQPIDTVTAEALDTTETGVDITTTTLPLWTTTGGNYPFDIMIGGERMTVTACSGSSNPQTLTVTRSVNGIVKSHASGVSVVFFRQSVYAL